MPTAAADISSAPIRSRRRLLLYILGTVGGVYLLLQICVMASFAVFFGKMHRNMVVVDAAASGNTARLHELLLQGADPNSEHREGSSALWWAVQQHHPETVHELLEHGATPNSRGQFNSVLETAYEETDYPDTFMHDNSPPSLILRDLVAHKVDPNTIADPVLRAEFLRAVAGR